MSEIVKTQALVLRKINYGDTSRIAQFYTEDYGKISAIIKGARSPKSKIGMLVDTMNLLEIVLYKKETREMQIISDIDLVKHYSGIRDNFEKYKYGSAIIELLTNLTFENEHSKRIFDGTAKMFSLLDENNTDPKFLFAKYFLFFLKESGYEFQIKKCSVCGKELSGKDKPSYNYESGIMCSECSKDRLTNFNLSEELFNLVACLNLKNNMINYTQENLDYLVKMLEKYLTYHVPEFKGIKSIKI
jgi:DNA repair protein RecO (recombination protein O)